MPKVSHSPNPIASLWKFKRTTTFAARWLRSFPKIVLRCSGLPGVLHVMPSFPRSAPVATILFLSLQFAVLGDDTNTPAIPPELAAADQLYRAGKFAEAESSYQAVLK